MSPLHHPRTINEVSLGKLARRRLPAGHVAATMFAISDGRFLRAGFRTTLIAGLAGTGKVKIIAAIYDLKTGVVTYLD
jgi:hypothetical protein